MRKKCLFFSLDCKLPKGRLYVLICICSSSSEQSLIHNKCQINVQRMNKEVSNKLSESIIVFLTDFSLTPSNLGRVYFSSRNCTLIYACLLEEILLFYYFFFLVINLFSMSSVILIKTIQYGMTHSDVTSAFLLLFATYH